MKCEKVERMISTSDVDKIKEERNHIIVRLFYMRREWKDESGK